MTSWIADPTFQAFVLGILQGLTEFLPISSSAHLLILPWFLDWEPMGLTFDVMLHAGTLVAVLAYFREDLRKLAVQILRAFRERSITSDDNLWVALAVGTIPALAVGGLFADVIEEKLRQPVVTTVTLSLFGLLLWWAGRRGVANKGFALMTWRDGLLVGVAQSLALVPGVSRSGITITAALLLGFGRVDSARFSFLLAVPVITLATLLKFLQLLMAESSYGVPDAGPLMVGVISSFASGFLCIKYLLQFLQKRTFLIFAIYRVLLSLAIFCYLVI